MNRSIITPGLYRHYKGNTYEVLGVAYHSETREPLVVYRSVKDSSEIWVRPYDMFLERVEVNGEVQPRFTRTES